MEISLRYQILRSRKYLSMIFFLVAIVALPSHVFGKSIWKISKDITILPEEMLALPKWCQIRMQAHPVMFNHADAKPVPPSILVQNDKIAMLFGKDIYVYAHHYCRGLNWLNRYKRSESFQYKYVENDRKYALSNAAGEFRFMKKYMKPKHRLYYDLLMNEAEVSWEEKNYKVAISNYLEILQRKPSYAPAYVKYAEILNTIGESSEAKKVLEDGLEKTNNSPLIEQALLELQGMNKNK